MDELIGTAFPKDASQYELNLVIENDAAEGYRAMLGCNRMRGAVTVEGDSINISPGISAMIACSISLATLEQQFGETLEKATDFAISGETLVFTGAEGNPLVIFTAVYF
jgi:heat shock protein HslJ